ncbi:hypothetical protein BHE74_00052926, partial [Ensete ventricosum]
ARKGEFRSVFCTLYQNFKIIDIPNVLAHKKSYEHGFAKKYDSHILYAQSRTKSSFDRFLAHHLRISKY